MIELSAPRGVVITAQLAGAWIFGALFFLSWIRIDELATSTAWPGTLAIMLIAAWLLGLYMVITYTRTASLLEETWTHRCVWMIAVWFGGMLGIEPIWEVAEAARPDLFTWNPLRDLVTDHAALLITFIGGGCYALTAGALLRDRRIRTVMITLAALLLGACVVAMRLLPADSLERRLRDRDIDRATTYTLAIPGYGHDRDFASIGIRATFDKEGPHRQSIKLSVAHAGDDPCASTTVCTPEDPGLTYIRTKYEHGYVRRHGPVDVRIMGGEEVDRTILRQAALSAHPVTDDDLLAALPRWRPDNAIQHFHHWLHSL